MRSRLLVTLGMVALVIALAGCGGGGGGGAVTFSITATTPANNATGVAVNAPLRLTFNVAASPSTLAYTSAPPATFTATWESSNTRLVLTPTANLASGAAYVITLTALDSASGTALTGTRALQFTTAGPAPTQFVVWRYPGGNAKPPTLAFSTPTKPGKGATVADPVYHTRIRRVTDRTLDAYGDTGLTNEYARVDPENASGTRAFLRTVNGNWSLYDVTTGARLRALNFQGNPDAEPRWHNTDPNLAFFVADAGLWQYDVAANRETRVRDFSGEIARCAFVRTRYEGEPSQDSRYWCLRLEDVDYHMLRLVCYDRQTDQIVGRLNNPTGDWDWVSMDISGNHCVLGSGDSSRAVAYRRDFTHPMTLPAGLGHADFALDASGRDVLVYQNTRTDWIAMVNLDTGVETNLLPIPFSDNTDIGLHFSGNCTALPGWVLVSTYGTQTAAKSWMDQCLFMVQLQANPVVWRVAQTFQVQDRSLPMDYFGEAFAAINRQGTRVWWGANWNTMGANNHRYETYTAELPSGWASTVPALAP